MKDDLFEENEPSPHNERPNDDAKSWDELAAAGDKLNTEYIACIKEAAGNLPIKVCRIDSIDGWDQHLENVYRKAHIDLHLAPKEDQLLSDSEAKFLSFLQREDQLIDKIGTSDEPSLSRDHRLRVEVRKNKVAELKSNVKSADDYVEDMFTRRCLQGAEKDSDKNACFIQGLSALRSVLESTEKDLEGILEPDEKNLQKDAHRLWEQYYDAESLFIDELHPASNGKISEKATKEKMFLIEHRIEQIYDRIFAQTDRK